ncbi:hypothetical protein GFM13_21085 [Rhizobium leguminosarum bv. viciae]|nr:hypothetical protein [Rhizobium leguminosarum bv. viciae]
MNFQNCKDKRHSTSSITSFSDDGRIAALDSTATNLAPDTNGAAQDVLIYDRGHGGSFSPALSADGKTVAFHSFATNLVPGESDDNGQGDIFVFDRTTGKMENITHGGNGFSGALVLSEHGNMVAFSSDATNLVAGETDSHNNTDILIFNQKTGTMENIPQGANDRGAVCGTRRGYVNIDPDRLEISTTASTRA